MKGSYYGMFFFKEKKKVVLLPTYRENGWEAGVKTLITFKVLKILKSKD